MTTVSEPRHCYSQPKLVRYGSVIELTASGSQGASEGNGNAKSKRAASVLR